MSVSVEHLPLVGYFGLILASLFTISPDLLRKPNAISLVFLALAAGSLFSTWSYMLAYFQRSFEDSAVRAGSTVAEYSTQAWLKDVSLFQVRFFLLSPSFVALIRFFSFAGGVALRLFHS
jgi:hypothetical protein